MRDNLLFELVSGHIPDWDNFEQEARRVGIRFHHDNYTVAVCLRSGWSRAGQDIGLPPGLRGTVCLMMPKATSSRASISRN